MPCLSFSRIVIIATISVITVGAAIAQPVGPGPKPHEARDQETPADLIIRVDPKIVDLGDINKGDKQTFTVKLFNISDTAVSIPRSFASCGCTVPQVSGDPIAPEESIEVEVIFNAKSVGPQQTIVTFYLSDKLGDVQLIVKANVLPVIVIDPEQYDLKMTKDLVVTLKSTDGIPFKINAADPEVIIGIDGEARLEHKVTLSAKHMANFQNRNRMIRIYVDHPRTQAVLLKSNKFGTSVEMRRLTTWARGGGAPEDLLTIIDEGIDIHGVDAADRTALMHAAQFGNIERVRLLLDFQADVHAIDRSGMTPLIAAARNTNGDIAMLQLLIDAGTDVFAKDRNGKTALHWAARLADTDTISLLLEYGLDVNTYAKNLETPLVAAVSSNKIEKVKLMVEAGANVKARDSQGRTAYDRALIQSTYTPGDGKVKLNEIADYLKNLM